MLPWFLVASHFNMDSLLLATFLPLAQATEHAPQPGEVAARIAKSLVAGESLFLTLAGIVIAVVVQIVSYWIAAKVVVGEKGSIGSAFNVWLLYLLIGIGFIMALAIAIPMLVIANDNTAAMAVIAGGFLLGLALVFLVPIKIFEIGLPRAFAFLILSWLLMFAAQAAILRAQGKPAFGGLPETIATLRSPERRDRLLVQLAGVQHPAGLDADLARLALAEERARPFPERQENLRKVYDALDARQKALPPGDARALKEYDELRAKYEELVRVLKADFAASKAQPPAP